MCWLTRILFRQNEEESSYDTKSAKSNLQNGHHNNSEFSKESKGRQNGYDNSDDRLVFFFGYSRINQGAGFFRIFTVAFDRLL